MFEISQLKEKKLSDLQEIAQKLNVPKYRTLKKLDLVYQILDVQAANPEVVKSEITTAPEEKVEKPKPAPKKKRERVEKKPTAVKTQQQKMELTDEKSTTPTDTPKQATTPAVEEPKTATPETPSPKKPEHREKKQHTPKEKDTSN